MQLKNTKKNKVWVFIGDMTSMMGSFYEVYNYSRNFNLPLEFVIEDNGKSVYTNTKKTCPNFDVIAWIKKNKIL